MHHFEALKWNSNMSLVHSVFWVTLVTTEFHPSSCLRGWGDTWTACSMQVWLVVSVLGFWVEERLGSALHLQDSDPIAF